MIETKNLIKEYEVGSQKVKALNGINLSVEKGEFISIMGPSGSGKTTLMNIIGCLDTPTNGTYNLNNKSVSQLSDDELAKIRNEEIGQNVKYWARPDINNRIEEGSIKAYFNADVKEITEDKIRFKTPDKEIIIENDFVLAMTGYKPNFELLESLEIEFQEDEYKTPVYNSTTMQSNQVGVYLAGVVCGGLKTNKWFIENSRVHANIIMDHVKEQTRKTS